MNLVTFIIIISSFAKIFQAHSFGFGGPSANGYGLPQNFPFIQNAIPSTTANTGPPTFPTLAPPIDPRIKKLDALVDSMLNAKNLQIQIPSPFRVKRKK
ncbi:unnamed protein product [Chironomus riparius]|uniref:Uncharacterized protein n=1 Tax=Chironomus riparius TaxID=315576 RepID=A0A9N9RM81_9DIPT|nr:unnamed protein product [Chironomus riparius]